MALEEFWRQKSDQELELAARQIAEYTEEAQQVIRAEVKKRELPEPPASTRTAFHREPEFLGNLSERLRLDGVASDGWARWIIGIPLALIFGLLLLASAAHSLRNLLVGAAIVGGVIWSIYRAIDYRNCYLLLHEKGVVYERPNERQSAYYDELQIWQEITQIRGAFYIPIRTIHMYTLQFPSGDRISTTQKMIGEKLQRMVTQHQLPHILEIYNRGHSVQMGAVCLDKKGITVQGEGVHWSDVSHVDVIKGVMYVYKSGSRFAAARTLVSDVPNVYVLLNLLEQLGYHSPKGTAV